MQLVLHVRLWQKTKMWASALTGIRDHVITPESVSHVELPSYAVVSSIVLRQKIWAWGWPLHAPQMKPDQVLIGPHKANTGLAGLSSERFYSADLCACLHTTGIARNDLSSPTSRQLGRIRMEFRIPSFTH
jgi:hypothetical protein